MDETTPITKAALGAELKNCAESFEYFCDNYVKVSSPKHGLVPFVLHNYQKRYIKHIESNRFSITKKFRQGGFTTLTIAWLVWRFIFKIDERNMVLSKTDDCARLCKKTADQILNNLPEFLRPNISKNTSHEFRTDELSNSLSFYTPEPSCGRSIHYLFIDEAAFIDKMDERWKCVYPCLSTGGNCIIVSTANGKKNWFYDTYSEAEKGRNGFKVFQCNYSECPHYDEDTSAQIKGNLGARGWRQQVLCEFLDPDVRTHNQKFNDAVNYFDEIEASQEFVESLKEEGEFNRMAERDVTEFAKTLCKLDLRHVNPAGDLMWEDAPDEPFAAPKPPKSEKAVNLDIGERITPKAYQFKAMSPSEARAFTQSYERRTPKVDQADFDKFEIKSIYDLAEFWSNMAEVHEDKWYQDEKTLWCDKVSEREEMIRETEETINEGITNDLLVLAGVMTKTEAINTPDEVYARPQKKIVDLAQEGFKNVKLAFIDGKLCVNKVPTLILEDDLRDLYNGTFSLKSYDEAISTTVKVIRDKLSLIFEKIDK